MAVEIKDYSKYVGRWFPAIITRDGEDTSNLWAAVEKGKLWVYSGGQKQQMRAEYGGVDIVEASFAAARKQPSNITLVDGTEIVLREEGRCGCGDPRKRVLNVQQMQNFAAPVTPAS